MAEDNLNLQWRVGDKVEKRAGYKWPGVIVAIFTTTANKRRYVVECTASGAEGALHIFRGGQLIDRGDPVPGLSAESVAAFEAKERDA